MSFSKKAEALLQQLGIPAEVVVARQLHEYPEAQLLAVAELGRDGRQHLLEPAAAEAWRHLKQVAAEAGIRIFIISAFRSIDRQTQIIKRKLAAGQRVEEILSVLAPPGFSEHHTGCAVDVGAPGCQSLEVEFADTDAFKWLQRHAESFGFVLSYPEDNRTGYQYEPWHWCYKSTQPAAGPTG